MITNRRLLTVLEGLRYADSAPVYHRTEALRALHGHALLRGDTELADACWAEIEDLASKPPLVLLEILRAGANAVRRGEFYEGQSDHEGDDRQDSCRFIRRRFPYGHGAFGGRSALQTRENQWSLTDDQSTML